MGKLKTILAAGPALNRIATTVDECLKCIEDYLYTKEKDSLLKGAWLFTYGFINAVDKWGFNLFSTRIYIPNRQSLGRLNLNQCMMVILSKLNQLGQEANVESDISDILDGNEVFDSYSYLVSFELKNKLKP